MLSTNHPLQQYKGKMISAEELLKPITDAKPCGDDLYYDPSFQELESMMKGKLETQFSAAEDPDWKALRERCLELFAKSKDLRVATTLCLAVVKTGGVLELGEALALVKGLLEHYWEPVYPQLDPADSNDPLYRVNTIAALATAKGTFGDPMRFLERLGQAPLTDSSQLGRISFAEISRSQGAQAEAVAGEKPVRSAAEIEAAFRDTKPEFLQAIHASVSASIQHVMAIDSFLIKTAGADKAPDLDFLLIDLKAIQKCVAPAGSAVSAEENQATEAAGDSGVTTTTGPAKSISGEIQSRQDVLKMLDKICQYYSRSEPSSPVPLLLRRAQRLAAMDFMAIINDMSPDAVAVVRTITGEKAEDAT